MMCQIEAIIGFATVHSYICLIDGFKTKTAFQIENIKYEAHSNISSISLVVYVVVSTV